MYQLINDQTGEAVAKGSTWAEMLGAFHRRSSFSYMGHKEYSRETFTIQPIE